MEGDARSRPSSNHEKQMMLEDAADAAIGWRQGRGHPGCRGGRRRQPLSPIWGMATQGPSTMRGLPTVCGVATQGKGWAAAVADGRDGLGRGTTAASCRASMLPASSVDPLLPPRSFWSAAGGSDAPPYGCKSRLRRCLKARQEETREEK